MIQIVDVSTFRTIKTKVNYFLHLNNTRPAYDEYQTRVVKKYQNNSLNQMTGSLWVFTVFIYICYYYVRRFHVAHFIISSIRMLVFCAEYSNSCYARYCQK